MGSSPRSQPPTTARGWLEDYGVARHLSPWEAAFVAQDSPSERMIFAASWRTEALQVLTWALGLIDRLPPPSERADLSLVGLTRDILKAPDAFAASATLRPEAELEAALAEMTSHHWGVRATDDFGRIVFELIERGEMRKTDRDQLSDFFAVYDFAEALDRGEGMTLMVVPGRHPGGVIVIPPRTGASGSR